jgi:hypothetical protein
MRRRNRSERAIAPPLADLVMSKMSGAKLAERLGEAYP